MNKRNRLTVGMSRDEIKVALQQAWYDYFTRLAFLRGNEGPRTLYRLLDESRIVREVRDFAALSAQEEQHARMLAYALFRRKQPDEAKALAILKGRATNEIFGERLEQIEGTKPKRRKRTNKKIAVI